jgi:hypothetical protein
MQEWWNRQTPGTLSEGNFSPKDAVKESEKLLFNS